MDAVDTKRLHVFLDASDYDAIKSAAEKSERDISKQVRLIVRQWRKRENKTRRKSKPAA